MQNRCTCGNVFEFSEKTIGTLVICQNCKREVVLKDDSNQKPPKLGGKKKLLRFFWGALFYFLFLVGVFIYLNYRENQKEKDWVLKATKAFKSTMGDSLHEQSKKLLNQARGQFPESVGTWKIVPSEEEWSWYVTYTLYNKEGYRLKEALFYVIASTPIEVAPMNELALELQGDPELRNQFVQHYEKKFKMPQINIPSQAEQFKNTQEQMERNPFFQKLKQRRLQQEEEEARKQR